MQAQNLAFALDDKHLSQMIAVEMIEILGRYDMNLCSQLIAFYQVSIVVVVDYAFFSLKSIFLLYIVFRVARIQSRPKS